jgi:hypothetical protein
LKEKEIEMNIVEYILDQAPDFLKKLQSSPFEFQALSPTIWKNIFYIEETPETVNDSETDVRQFLLDLGFKQPVVEDDSIISRRFTKDHYLVLIVKDVRFIEKFEHIMFPRESLVQSQNDVLDLLELTHQFEKDTK